MNWLALILVGGAAAWFEFNYQRSRKGKAPAKPNGKYPVPETAHVEQRDGMPSISPGAENDKKLNTPA
jgi:hypothetical protein